MHSTAYCQAVEKAADIEVPARGRFIRTILLELERVQSHLLWLGIAGHIIGFETVLMQSWRIREPVMWLCEKITGNRKLLGMNLVGGVRRDIPKEIHEELLDVLERVEKETRAVIDAVSTDTTLFMRCQHVGVVDNKMPLRWRCWGQPPGHPAWHGTYASIILMPPIRKWAVSLHRDRIGHLVARGGAAERDAGIDPSDS